MQYLSAARPSERSFFSVESGELLFLGLPVADRLVSLSQITVYSIERNTTPIRNNKLSDEPSDYLVHLNQAINRDPPPLNK